MTGITLAIAIIGAFWTPYEATVICLEQTILAVIFFRG